MLWPRPGCLAPQLYSFWQCRKGTYEYTSSPTATAKDLAKEFMKVAFKIISFFFSSDCTRQEMITWNQTWHPTCRTWLRQLEQCLNNTLLPALIKQNTPKLKSNGRIKMFSSWKQIRKRWEQRACQRKFLHWDQRKKLVTKAGSQKDWEMYFWSPGT